MTTTTRKMFQHRLVVECRLGRLLLPDEFVHHRNHIQWDNRLSNLEVVDRATHALRHRHPTPDSVVTDLLAQHSKKNTAEILGISYETLRNNYGHLWTRRPVSIDLTEDQVRKALRGRSTTEAAKLLGIHPQSLYGKFGHLLDKRRSPFDPLSPELLQQVIGLAEDPMMSTRKAAGILEVTPVTLRAWCHLHEIAWTSAPVGRPKSRPQ